MKKKKIKSYGWCFIIEGFAGSGKTSLSKEIHKKIERKLGKTIILDGDYLRKFFHSIKFKIGYTKKDRGKYAALPIALIINSYLSNNINVIYTNVGYNKSASNVWIKHVKNLYYILLDTKISEILKLKRKPLYFKKKQKNIVGIDIKPEFPKKVDILLRNNFKFSTKVLGQTLMKKIIEF